MIHYHGAHINPREAIYQMAGRSFCVSYAEPGPVEVAHQIGEGVLLDNGAWSFFNSGKPTDWDGYIEWLEPWLSWHTTWAIIPDVIGGTGEENDDLLAWFTERAHHLNQVQLAPVWHVNQPVERLERLCQDHYRVCVGSGPYQPGTDQWRFIMNQAFDAITDDDGVLGNWVHLLRGISLAGDIYPFASVDSASLARAYKGNNQGVAGFDLKKKADEVDGRQCPGKWNSNGSQMSLEYQVPDQPHDYMERRKSNPPPLFDRSKL